MLVGALGRKVLELIGAGLIWWIEAAAEEEGVLEERRVCRG